MGVRDLVLYGELNMYVPYQENIPPFKEFNGVINIY